MKSLRGRVLAIVVVPGAALVLVALVVGVFLVLQANRVRTQADRVVDASNNVTRTVAGLQAQRRPATYTALTRRIDDAIGELRELARAAPDAEAAYRQNTAVDLLVASEGLYRADSLALGGLDATTRPLFTDAVGGYRTTLAGSVGRLTPAGRARYETLVHTDDWRTLTAVDNAFVAAAPLPVTPVQWRAATAKVGHALGELFARQNDFAVQLIVDRAHRMLVGALAAAAAIAGLAALVLTVAVQLADRLASQVGRRGEGSTDQLRKASVREARLPVTVRRRLGADPGTRRRIVLHSWSQPVWGSTEKSKPLAHTRGGRHTADWGP